MNNKSYNDGIRQMEEKILLCVETKRPIGINDRLFFIKTDKELIDKGDY